MQSMQWRHATGLLALDRPRIVGIINMTPDSFSDGGRLRTLDDVRQVASRLIAEGADVLDVGGESTRPQGAQPVSADDELRRVVPAISAIRVDHPDVPLSIDTNKARVASAALGLGVSIVNDVSGFRLDPAMAEVCAAAGAGVVLMHSRGDVADMATFVHSEYGADVTGAVVGELQACVERATRVGIAADQIVLDPGIGFSKRGDQSVRVLHELSRVVALGYPVLVGVSRKRFIGHLTGVSVPTDRVAGTTGANVAALDRGARLFRVHDVRAAREALDVAWAIAAEQDYADYSI
ncbi:MAG TPA: dihydropteroate synthase [Gemmatimonadaceae bacterium]|jgi:dihydropteroate synthase